jgi:hypothetical protein
MYNALWLVIILTYLIIFNGCLRLYFLVNYDFFVLAEVDLSCVCGMRI